MSKVRYNQSGYFGSSMSLRAVEAYEAGEKPKSKWTKKVMLAAIKKNLVVLRQRHRRKHGLVFQIQERRIVQ